MHQHLDYLLSGSAPDLDKAMLSPPNLPARDAQTGKPLRLAADDMTRYQFTHQHVKNRTIDFALRMMIQQTGKRSRDLLHTSAALGRPWIRGAHYRLSTACADQLLRLAQTQPEMTHAGMDALGLKNRLMMQLRIAWRVLTKQA